MIEKPTTIEIDNVIYRLQSLRDQLHTSPAHVRCLDIELHALRLLMFITRIGDEETQIAAGVADG